METSVTYRCRKCRFSLNVSDAVIKSGTDCSVSSRTIDLDTDDCPAWIMDIIDEAGWRKGKIKCEKCAGRLGSFDFVKDHSCKGVSGTHYHSPVHLLRDRVDEVGTSTHQPACSQPVLAASSGINPALGCVKNMNFTSLQLASAYPAQPQDLPAGENRTSVSEGRLKADEVACDSFENSDWVDILSEHEFDDANIQDFVSTKSRTSLEYPNREIRSRKLSKVKKKDHGHVSSKKQSNSDNVISEVRAGYSTGIVRQKVNNRFMALESGEELEELASAVNLDVSSRVPLKANHSRKRQPRKMYKNRLQDSHQFETCTTEEEEIPTEMCCPVCLEILFSPYKCRPCDHIFCELCLRKIARHQPNFTSCPLCRKVIKTCVSDTDLVQRLKSNFPKQYQERYLESRKMNSKLLPLPRCTRRESFARNVQELLFDGTNRIWFLTYCLPILLLFSHISIALFIFLRTIWQSIRNSLF